MTDHDNHSVPEMARLSNALGGDWNTVETMERSRFFPQGGSRRGVAHARLAADGNVLVYEVQSDGPAGKLDGMLVIWWEAAEGQYRFFSCFNDPSHPCEMRGIAHWDADVFVNEYEVAVDGKKTLFQDSFRFTPTSHTLTAAMQTGDGTFKILIRAEATRR